VFKETPVMPVLGFYPLSLSPPPSEASTLPYPTSTEGEHGKEIRFTDLRPRDVLGNLSALGPSPPLGGEEPVVGISFSYFTGTGSGRREDWASLSELPAEDDPAPPVFEDVVSGPRGFAVPVLDSPPTTAAPSDTSRVSEIRARVDVDTLGRVLSSFHARSVRTAYSTSLFGPFTAWSLYYSAE